MMVSYTLLALSDYNVTVYIYEWTLLFFAICSILLKHKFFAYPSKINSLSRIFLWCNTYSVRLISFALVWFDLVSQKFGNSS